MSSITNNTPKVVLNGIKDESVKPLIPEADMIPIHLPLLYLQTESGPLEPTLVMSGDLTRIYGDGTIDTRKPFFNHATKMAMTILAEGNSVLVKRVVANTAKMASLTLVVTVDKTVGVIKHYARNPDGSVIMGSNGDPTYAIPAVPVNGGILLKYSWIPTSTYNQPILDSNNLLIGYDDFPTFIAYAWANNSSAITYPILTVEAAHMGAYGNSIGMRLWKAGPNTSAPGDIDIINDQDALLYTAQLVQRTINNTTEVIENLYSGKSLEFSFKPNAYSYKTNMNLDIQDLIKLWGDDGIAAGISPTFGPLGKVTVHETFLESILADLLVAENFNAPTLTSTWLLDFLTGLDVNDIHHYGFQIDPSSARLTEGRTQYLLEGDDGDLTAAAYNAAVANEIDFNSENSSYPLRDSAHYPFSALYDSGYPINVKKKFFKWTSMRKDVHVAVCTHTAGEDVLSISEEISVAADLRSSASVYAESDVHGTGVCRVVIVGHCGQFISDNYKERVSLIFELAAKRARYLGAGTGVMKAGLGYDNAPYNQISLLKNVNNTYMTSAAKEAVWSAGICFVQRFDRNTLFFPGLQTVYAIKNSVLTSEMIMQICVDVTKKCEMTWRLLTGNTILTQGQFIEKSNKILLGLVEGKYDDRVTIVPRTYFTPSDTARGYSWSMDVAVYGNTMRTVGTMNVISRQPTEKVINP